ncbi:MAG: leucyl aminopeptidase, partial [Planctomycetota bacterium]
PAPAWRWPAAPTCLEWVFIRRLLMKITTAHTELAKLHTPLLVLPLAEKQKLPAHLPGSVREQAARALKKRDFKAKQRETTLVYGEERGIERVLLVGLGDKATVDAELLRRVSALGLRRARSLSLKRYHMRCPVDLPIGGFEVGEALAEGARLAGWTYLGPRKVAPEDHAAPPDLEIVLEKRDARVEAGVERGDIVTQGTNLARELAIIPPNAMTPSTLARRAQQVARQAGFKCRVYGPAVLERLEMGGLLGVARGSSEPARLIVMDYHPRGARHTICLAGKGLTFDSGGLSLKPAKSMEEMKFDMCGAAAVIGVLQTVARLKPRVRVVGIVPSTENMPDGAAIKPGDVLRTCGGLTVEVLNTDAEGRLVLADALEYAKRFHPSATIDIATLTGAVVVALGHEVTGYLTTDDTLSERLFAAGESTGERVWRLPLYPEYGEGLKSTVADIANVANKPGAGTIQGAWFLNRFAEGMRWAHLDIAGTAWEQRSRDYYESGPSGVGVRLLVRLIEEWR